MGNHKIMASSTPFPKRQCVFKFLGFKGGLEKLRFRDGLKWTVGLTEEIKLRFHISSEWCGLYLHVLICVNGLNKSKRLTTVRELNKIKRLTTVRKPKTLIRLENGAFPRLYSLQTGGIWKRSVWPRVYGYHFEKGPFNALQRRGI